jgi:hypothetical protein
MPEDNSRQFDNDPQPNDYNHDEWDGPEASHAPPDQISLNLDIDDPLIVEALRGYPNGVARARFVEQALRIGVLAIRSASGQIDSDVVRNEGARLINELSYLVQTYQIRTSEELEGVLKEYFNPKNGRFTENVDRLVRQDGDLQQLLQNHLNNAQAGIQKTISQLVGPDSSLMQMLRPGETNIFFENLSKVANTAVETQNRAILQQFSLDVPESALNRLLAELRTNHTNVGSNLQNHITEVMREFSLDHEDSALNKMLKQIHEASTQIRGEFTLDNEESALARVRRELRQLIEAQNQSAQAFQERISNELSALFARRQEAQRGVQHGNEFEAAVVSSLQEMLDSGDEIEATGNTTGEIPRSKVGDAVITLGPDCVAAGARIVVEAKKDDSYNTIAQAREEMATARENRRAQYGIFVVAAGISLAERVGMLRRFDNDILVVWDAEDRNADVALKCAVMMAKGLIVRAAKEREGFAADLDAMDAATATIVRLINGFEEVTTSANTIRNGADRILHRARIMREGIEKEIETLSNEIQGLRRGN